jgi:hypothetical protein
MVDITGRVGYRYIELISLVTSAKNILRRDEVKWAIKSLFTCSGDHVLTATAKILLRLFPLGGRALHAFARLHPCICSSIYLYSH